MYTRVGWIQENKMYTRVGWVQEIKMYTQGRLGSVKQDVYSGLVGFRRTRCILKVGWV